MNVCGRPVILLVLPMNSERMAETSMNFTQSMNFAWDSYLEAEGNERDIMWREEFMKSRGSERKL